MDFQIFNVGEPLSQWIIPLGVVFFTFTILSYLIEVKERKFSLNVTFEYSQPICFSFQNRTRDPLKDLRTSFHNFNQPHKFDYDQFVDGLKQMLWGFLRNLSLRTDWQSM